MSANAQHEELRRRIRSLTSLLHKFAVQESPPRKHKDHFSFLRHFTTLLTCGDNHVRNGVIAVAGSIVSNRQPRALIVAQNPSFVSLTGNIRLKVVEKDNRTLEEVIVKGSANPDLVDHIGDVLTALSAYDLRATNRSKQRKSLEVFFLSRSWREFTVRFEEGSRPCGGKHLYEVINEWQPDPARPEITTKWVNPPRWLLDVQLPTKSREVQGHVQWEFSDETKRVWSSILAMLLITVEKSIEKVKVAKGKTRKKGEEELRTEMDELNTCLGYLYYFVFWKADIAKSLLTETNMVSAMPTEFMSMEGDTISDDLADLHQEPHESKGHQVYRYLKMVTAWHAAVNDLCHSPVLPEFLKNSVIGLVETPPSPSSILSSDEISAELFSRFPSMMQDRQAVLELIQSRHPPEFSGCVHAEATLMGLLNFYGPGSTHSSYAPDAELQDPGTLRQIVQPVAEAGDAVIAVSKKCCWCCDWLGKNLETEFMLPDTHGILFPWDPPKIGVATSVLEKLEKELWQELRRAVSSKLEPRHDPLFGSPATQPFERDSEAKVNLAMRRLFPQ